MPCTCILQGLDVLGLGSHLCDCLDELSPRLLVLLENCKREGGNLLAEMKTGPLILIILARLRCKYFYVHDDTVLASLRNY